VLLVLEVLLHAAATSVTAAAAITAGRANRWILIALSPPRRSLEGERRQARWPDLGRDMNAR
jgi:hypothetical protein